MENMIRYLYEYRDGRRVRNVGFVKAEQNDQVVTLQIHGRATFLRQADVRVYLFFSVKDNCYGIPMGELNKVQSILSARLSYDREEIEKYTDYDTIQGVILDAGEQGSFAAVWDESVVPIEKMRLARERTKTPFQEEPEKLENVTEKTVEAEAEAEAKTEAPEAETDIQEIPEAEAEEFVEAAEAREEGNRAEPQYRKVGREDLSELPKKEWYLANNSFLLHGCRNYRHLLFIEDGDEFYIGVPGIYHPREAMAARSFGFPEFRKISPEESRNIGLAAQEMSTREIFGYWCRRVNRQPGRKET